MPKTLMTSAKEQYNQALIAYQEEISYDFNCNVSEYKRINTFFNKTNDEVLKTALTLYKKKLASQLNKQEFKNFKIKTPVIVTGSLTESEKQLLLYLYTAKLVELDFDSIGLTSTNIVREAVNAKNISSKIIDYKDKYIYTPNTFSLSMEFSLIKNCLKEEQIKRKIKK